MEKEKGITSWLKGFSVQITCNLCAEYELVPECQFFFALRKEKHGVRKRSEKQSRKFRIEPFLKGAWVSRGLKPLFSFALRKGKTWSFSLPVGATGIFKRPLRGLKTAKTPA